MKTLLAIQAKLEVPKSQFNEFGGYNFRSCEDILKAVKPLLEQSNATLIISDEIVAVGTPFVCRDSDGNEYVCGQSVFVKATATLSADGEEPVCVSAFARHPEARKGMDDSQITGATSSYARKYALNGLFCIDDNRDADATNTHGKGESQPRNPEKVPQGTQKQSQRSNARNTHAQKNAAPARKPAEQPTQENPIDAMITYMGNMGVSVEAMEKAIGAPIDQFTDEDIALIKSAARIMRKEKFTFEDAMAEV